MTLEDKYRAAKAKMLQQQILISQLRAENTRLRTLRLRIATGDLADAVDLERELGDQKRFLKAGLEDYEKFVVKLTTAAKTSPEAKTALDALT